MTAVWDWLRRWGAWVVAAVAAAAAAVFYFLSRKKDAPSEGKPEQAVEVQQARQAAERAQDAQVRADQSIEQANQQAQQSWDIAINHVVDETDLIKDDPVATDRFLDQVGDEMRRK